MKHAYLTHKPTRPGQTTSAFRSAVWFTSMVVFFLSSYLPLQAAPASIGPPSKARSGAEVYEDLRRAMNKGDADLLFERLIGKARSVDWTGAQERSFQGNIRPLGNAGVKQLLLLRSLEKGDIYVLRTPIPGEAVPPIYEGLNDLAKHRLLLKVRTVEQEVNGQSYHFAELVEKPVQPTLDKLFRIAIIAMLFFVMVGMGLTLRIKDFAMVVIKPRGMLVGPLLQFGMLPALAAGLGHLAGYPESYPFMFVGLILIASSPGGVTSNLMTYWAKGDLALSVSMTAISTVLSLVLTPLLILLYASNLPGVEIPKGDVAAQILVLVIVPLAVGMSVRARFEDFAKRAEKFFSGLGVFALLFLMITGVAGNFHTFADTARYGLKFYSIILTLTLSSMALSVFISKVIFRVDNFQTRAVALETGLQNAALAMTIALLLQDRVGDFHSSMFAVSGLYGLWMYVAGVIMIFLFPKILPVDLHFHVRRREEG